MNVLATRTPPTAFLVLCLVPSWLAGCLDVADERAETDGRVGRAETDALSVAVDHGLAAVRGVDGSAVHLWASAPTLSATLENRSDQPSDVRFRVQNLLPDAALEARIGGETVDVVAEPGAVPTERTWRFSVPARADARVTITAPDQNDRSPWSFLVFGDVQEAVDEVQDVFARMNRVEGARFVLMVGDLTEDGTPEELTRFERELRGLDIPCYATLGNHELGAGEPAYHAHFGRGTYHFDFRGVRFILADSASATIASRARDWIARWTREAPHGLTLVGMHIPPFDPVGVRSGAFTSHDEAGALLSDLARGGVDATFYGHVHSYYAFQNAGMPAYITGGGGAIPERWDGVGRHFLHVRPDPESEELTTALVRVEPD